MERECHQFVGACQICGGTRSQGTIGADPRASPTPDAPFQVIHVDHKGALPRSNGYTHVLVVVCALTKFTLYIPVTDTKGSTTLTALQDQVFANFGYPLVIISDNGSFMANNLMKASEDLYGYRRVFVMPHTPQANGLAEAAVKKLKLILDRHTLEYEGWHALCGMAQTAVNQRVSSGTMECPFTAVFGRQPVTLTALENPSLLPSNLPEQRSIRDLAHTMSRLHRRLQSEADAIKDVRVLNSAQHQTGRPLQCGDRIWLTYSDSERARYLRKHGHGIPWRHPFVVEAVKPHAVKLIIPKDGSVPDVLPWQSLRKCAMAAPRFQRDDLLIPDVNASSVPIVPQPPQDTPVDGSYELPDAATPSAPLPTEDYTPETRYLIERILQAERLGKGRWRVHVKWENYSDDCNTYEPLGKVLKDIKGHPDLLKQIDECKEAYYVAHPRERALDEAPTAPTDVPEPTRVQPTRDRDQPRRLVFHVSAETDDQWLVSTALRKLRQSLSSRNDAISVITSDFEDHAALLPPLPICC